MSSRIPGVRLHLTGPTAPDPLPARDRSGVTTCSGEGSAQGQNGQGPRTPHGVPDPHILSGPLSGREQTPRLGGPKPPHVRRSRYACGHQAPSERLAHLPHSMREALSALCHSRARGDFCQVVLLIARYQGAQCSRWRHPCHAHQSATPVRHDSSATEYHNAYAVDPTVYHGVSYDMIFGYFA